jgi:hypothetical protein
MALPGDATFTGDLVMEKIVEHPNYSGWRQIALPLAGNLSNLSGLTLLTSETTPASKQNIFRWNAETPAGSSGDTATGWVAASENDNNVYAYTLYNDNTNNVHDISATIRMKGSLFNEDYTVNLAYTRDGASPEDSLNAYGWNHIPVRFASSLSFASLTTDDGFQPSYKGIHFWYPPLQQYIGFRGTNGSEPLITYNTNPTNQGGGINLGAWTSFWVKADAPGQSITVKNSFRNTDPRNFFIFFKKEQEFMRLNIYDTENRMDQLAIGFDYESTDGFDGAMDILKLKTSNPDYPSFYSVTEKGMNMSGNFVTYPEGRKTIQLMFESFKPGMAYTITPDLDHLSWTGDIVLEDTKTGKFTDIRAKKEYTFTHEGGAPADRFKLHFGANASSAGALDKSSSSFYVYQENGNIMIKWSAEVNAQVEVYDLSGRKLYSGEASDNDLHTIRDLQTAKGVLLVKISSENGTETQKIIK